MAKREKYTVEFIIGATPSMIYSMISNAPGLSQWFADVEPGEDHVFTFNWAESSEKARLERSQPNKIVRFKWLERTDPEYLTMEISKDELTDEVALIITDFDEVEEIEEAKKAWKASIDQLRETMGA